MTGQGTILVLGLGNSLLSDDGFGIHVINALGTQMTDDLGIRCLDGGTLGLSLLPDIEDAEALILVDAAEVGAAAGALRLFEGAAMDAQLGGKKRTVHEVAAFDLMSAAALTGHHPRNRALLAVQPQSTDWGLEPTQPVMAAIPEACAMVERLVRKWRGARS